MANGFHVCTHEQVCVRAHARTHTHKHMRTHTEKFFIAMYRDHTHTTATHTTAICGIFGIHGGGSVFAFLVSDWVIE